MPNRVDLEEEYVERVRLTEMGGFTTSDFTDFIRRNNITPNEQRMYPVFKIISALNTERKKRQHGKKGAGVEELERDKKHEEVMKIRIDNQAKLGILISREYAKERMRMAFQAVAIRLRYSIKNVAPRLIGLDNARLVEEILTKAYNSSILGLEEEAQNVTWEEDGVTNKLGRTGVASDSGTQTGN